MKKSKILLITLVIIISTLFSGCELVDNGMVKLGLKNKDFEIYVGELQEKFLDVMISRNSKSEFDENIKKFGIIHGVNYGKQL